MSPGRRTTGNASGGEKRSKSGEFSAVSDAAGVEGPAAKNPASIPPNAVEIDSEWDRSDSGESPELAKALAPRRVISIGPPAQATAETSDVTLLDRRSKAKDAFSPVTKSEPPQSHGVLPTGVDSKSLEKLLTEGAAGDFSTSDIGQLVTNVMSRPKSEPPGATIQAARPSSAPPDEAAEGVMEPDGWDLQQPAPIVVEQALVKPELVVEPASVKTPAAEAEPVSVKPVPAGKVEKAPSSAAAAPKKRTSKSTRTRGSARQIGAEKKGVQTDEPHTAAELDSGWTGEFFAVKADAHGHTDEYQDHDEFIDERQRRSLSPEVRARRAKYRRIVLGLFVAMLILLAAAVALKLLYHR